MRVGVGSGNPVKRDATLAVLESDADVFGVEATVESVRVDSGVSDQPTGHAETRLGAETRAEAVVARAAYDLGVGIEGGVATYDEELYLIMWAAVTDGSRWGRGAGPSIRLPATIADRVRAGEELGPVMDDVLEQGGVARDQGAAGALTGGRIDRTAALSTAVAGALGPFVTDLYD